MYQEQKTADTVTLPNRTLTTYAHVKNYHAINAKKGVFNTTTHCKMEQWRPWENKEIREPEENKENDRQIGQPNTRKKLFNWQRKVHYNTYENRWNRKKIFEVVVQKGDQTLKYQTPVWLDDTVVVTRGEREKHRTKFFTILEKLREAGYLKASRKNPLPLLKIQPEWDTKKKECRIEPNKTYLNSIRKTAAFQTDNSSRCRSWSDGGVGDPHVLR